MRIHHHVRRSVLLAAQFPRLLIFCGSIVLAYALYRYGAFHWIEDHLSGASWLSIFVAGFLFSFGFTAPFAAAFFIEVAHDFPPLPAALLAAAGAMTSDIGIFQFTSMSLGDELQKLRATQAIQHVHAFFHHERIHWRVRAALRWILACIIIASPLPDEVGMTVVAGFTNLKGWRLSLLCFALNTVGILAIFLLARGF